MSTITIGFSKPKKFMIGSWLISKWMNQPYSHVFIKFDSKQIPSTVYHAAHGMVHFMELENFKRVNEIVKEYSITVEDSVRKEFLVRGIYLAGSKYAYDELVKIMFMDILNSLDIKIKTFDSKGYICSELVGYLMNKQLNVEFDKPLYLLRPDDIDKKLEELYGKA